MFGWVALLLHKPSTQNPLSTGRGSINICKFSVNVFCLDSMLFWYDLCHISILSYSWKSPNSGVEDILFCKKNPRILRFVTLPLEIPEKAFTPRTSATYWHPLEVSRSKTKSHGNSTCVFLEHPWKFNFFFNWSLEYPDAISPIRQEIPSPKSPVCFFLE